MNKISKIRYTFLLQLGLFAGLLFCAVFPVRIFLLFTAIIFILLPYRRYWLWSSILTTVYAFFFFSSSIMHISGSAIGSVRRLVTPLPEIVKESKVQAPIISIVIPAYNYENHVGKAVETAATQQFHLPYEVVVVDDDSNDATLKRILDIAQKYPHVSVYHQVHNRGLITTKNAGITLARGKWIYNLDADDYIAPDALATLFSLTDKNTGGDLVFSTVHSYGAKEHDNHFCYGTNTLDYNCVPNSVLYRKSDWQKLGPYDYLFQKGVEDWDFALAFKQANKKIVMADRAVYFALVKETSRSTDANKYTHTLWWNIQAKYASQLTLKQRAEIIFCGFYRFYCKQAIEKRFQNYRVLYKLTNIKNA